MNSRPDIGKTIILAVLILHMMTTLKSLIFKFSMTNGPITDQLSTDLQLLLSYFCLVGVSQRFDPIFRLKMIKKELESFKESPSSSGVQVITARLATFYHKPTEERIPTWVRFHICSMPMFKMTNAGVKMPIFKHQFCVTLLMLKTPNGCCYYN